MRPWGALDRSGSAFRVLVCAFATFSVSMKVVAVQLGLVLEQAPRLICLLCEKVLFPCLDFASYLAQQVLKVCLSEGRFLSLLSFVFSLLSPFLLFFLQILKIKTYFLSTLSSIIGLPRKSDIQQGCTSNSQLSGPKFWNAARNLIS